MGRGRGQPQQRQIKGFRPGKEPPEMRKRAARQQFGEMNKAQERLVGMFAERTPAEAMALMRRWRLMLLGGAIVLGALAIALFFWSVIAGVITVIVALVVLFFWWNLHRQQAAFEAMADAVSGQPGGKRRRK